MYEIPLDGLKDNNKDYTLVLMLFQSWALVSAQSVVYSIHSVLARSRTRNCGPRQLLLGTYKERLIRCSLVAVGQTRAAAHPAACTPEVIFDSIRSHPRGACGRPPSPLVFGPFRLRNG
eukprot:COSAG06_NODE_12051_length_1429_cov_5.548872_1_plen_118_part_10